MKRRQGKRRPVWLYVAAVASVAALLGIALFLPLVPFRPICSVEFGRAQLEVVPGRIAPQFLAALDAESQFGRPWVRAGEARLVRLVDWLDREWYLNVTTKAVYRLVELRTGADMSEIWDGRAKIPGFDRWGNPGCEAVHDIAIVDGKWEREGPPVRYVDDAP